MAKQIIILDNWTDQVLINIRCVFWFPIVAAKRVPLSGVTSIYAGATTAENTDIQTGAVLEEVRNFKCPVGTTVPQIKTALISVYNERKSVIDNAQNTRSYYGTYYDGSVWV